MANAREWSLHLDQWFKDECEDRIRIAIQKIGMDLLRRVVLKTPVDSGRLRANWLVTIGSPSGSSVERLEKASDAEIRAGSAETIRTGAVVLNGLSEAQAIYLTNNLPYATAIENGHSKQAPAGMVAVTLAEVQAQLGGIVR